MASTLSPSKIVHLRLRQRWKEHGHMCGYQPTVGIYGYGRRAIRFMAFSSMGVTSNSIEQWMSRIVRLKHFVRDSSSFCLTDSLVASVYKQTERNRHRLQVHFNDFNLTNFKTVRLGPFNGDIMMQTDGDNQFYILAGGKTMHVISSAGNKEFFNLSNCCDTFAVVDSRCVVVNREHRTLTVLTLRKTF